MVKSLKIILLILVILLSGAFIFHDIFQSKSSPPATPSSLLNSSLTDEERLELLQKPSDIPPINSKMTDKERLKLLNKPSKVPPLQTN